MNKKHFIIGLVLSVITSLIVVLQILAQTPGLILPGEVLLVWQAPGTDVGQHLASQTGQLFLYNTDGSATPVLDVPQQTQRVVACTDQATTSTGKQFAFFVGNETSGDLYIMESTKPEFVLVKEDLNTMVCIGNGTFQFSPAGGRYAYLDYTNDFRSDLSPYGRLYIEDATTYETIIDFENVAGFHLTDDGAAIVQFYNNNDNEAVEVAFTVWDNNEAREREIAAITADEENDQCLYTSASVRELADNRMAAILGYRCARGIAPGQTQWQLYIIDPETRSSTLTNSAVSGGGFFSFSRTNNIYSAPDNDQFFFTVPDGISNRSVSLLRSNAIDTDVSTVIDRFALMPNLSVLPYDAINHVPELSNDGRWLAVVKQDGNNSAELNILDMSAPDLPPIIFKAGSRGDTIAEVIFAPDNNTVYVVAGGTAGNNNALFAIDLASGTETRITRGRFEQGVISPDGTRLALINWEVFDDEEPPYQQLVVVDIATGDMNILFEGGEVVDGELENATFAYPLSWRAE